MTANNHVLVTPEIELKIDESESLSFQNAGIKPAIENERQET